MPYSISALILIMLCFLFFVVSINVSRKERYCASTRVVSATLHVDASHVMGMCLSHSVLNMVFLLCTYTSTLHLRRKGICISPALQGIRYLTLLVIVICIPSGLV